MAWCEWCPWIDIFTSVSSILIIYLIEYILLIVVGIHRQFLPPRDWKMCDRQVICCSIIFCSQAFYKKNTNLLVVWFQWRTQVVISGKAATAGGLLPFSVQHPSRNNYCEIINTRTNKKTMELRSCFVDIMRLLIWLSIIYLKVIVSDGWT